MCDNEIIILKERWKKSSKQKQPEFEMINLFSAMDWQLTEHINTTTRLDESDCIMCGNWQWLV